MSSNCSIKKIEQIIDLHLKFDKNKIHVFGRPGDLYFNMNDFLKKFFSRKRQVFIYNKVINDETIEGKKKLRDLIYDCEYDHKAEFPDYYLDQYYIDKYTIDIILYDITKSETYKFIDYIYEYYDIKCIISKHRDIASRPEFPEKICGFNISIKIKDKTKEDKIYILLADIMIGSLTHKLAMFPRECIIKYISPSQVSPSQFSPGQVSPSQ
jgi:hypothetical protein